MLCHPDISLPANYALQIRMSRLSMCAIAQELDISVGTVHYALNKDEAA